MTWTLVLIWVTASAGTWHVPTTVHGFVSEAACQAGMARIVGDADDLLRPVYQRARPVAQAWTCVPSGTAR